MIRKRYIIPFFFLLSAGTLWAQQTLESLRLHYERFEYQKVVEQARTMLLQRDRMDPALVKEVLYLSAVANYSQQKIDAAMIDFLELLRMDPTYQLNPSTTSPKIVQFFQEIKSHSDQAAPSERIVIKHDTLRIPVYDKTWRPAVTRSLLWPGWGQSYQGATAKGAVLRSASLLAFSAAVYGVMDCRDKSKTYHNTVEKSAMDETYQAFNRAYKFRNTALTSFAAIWVYSQIDLLLLHKTKPPKVSCGWIIQPGNRVVLSCSLPLP